MAPQLSIAGEHSFFVGLHIQHLVSGNYTEFRDDPVDTGELRDGYWVMQYPDKELNDGYAMNNQLFGYRYEGTQYSFSFLTYKNSFYERSYGVAINKLYRFNAHITIEYGAMLVTGYRKALLTENINNSMKQEPMLVPMASISYSLYGDTSLSYTNIAIGVGIMSLETKY